MSIRISQTDNEKFIFTDTAGRSFACDTLNEALLRAVNEFDPNKPLGERHKEPDLSHVRTWSPAYSEGSRPWIHIYDQSKADDKYRAQCLKTAVIALNTTLRQAHEAGIVIRAELNGSTLEPYHVLLKAWRASEKPLVNIGYQADEGKAKPRLCVECRWCVIADDPEDSHCTNPEVMAQHLYQNGVTGKQEVRCQIERGISKLTCGPEGLKWETVIAGEAIKRLVANATSKQKEGE